MVENYGLAIFNHQHHHRVVSLNNYPSNTNLETAIPTNINIMPT